MVNRHAAPELLRLLGEYPVVILLGPRQSGKTTLARSACPGFGYANLEDPELRRLAQEDPRAFLAQFPAPLIIDEVQRVPELLSYIQVEVDRRGETGLYLLTGSHQLALGEAIGQSLAGRTALLQLWPLSLAELGEQAAPLSREELMFRGTLPRVWSQPQDPLRAYRNYFQTYVERDLRLISRVHDLTLFETFMRLLAGRVGQLFNASALAADVGISANTAQEWLSVLEASFIVFRLQPFHSNFGKRLVKSPKVYFVETGLAVSLLGIESPQQLARDPLMGSLFENLVMAELFKQRLNRGLEPLLYFFRDNNGNEVDALFDQRPAPLPIEIKAALTWHSEFLRGLQWVCKQCACEPRGLLLYGGDLGMTTQGMRVGSFRAAGALLGEVAG